LTSLAKGLTLETGEHYKIVIRRFVVDVVEMENVHFHHNSAVVLQWRYGENSVAQGRLWHRNGAPQ
jgi:hypothetical protein